MFALSRFEELAEDMRWDMGETVESLTDEDVLNEMHTCHVVRGKKLKARS